LAISVAAIAAQEKNLVYGLIILVSLVNIDLNLNDDSWGENESIFGLTPDRLLGNLKTTFEGKFPDYWDH